MAAARDEEARRPPPRASEGLSPDARRPTGANPAQRAEPRTIGTARARDPLAREVKLLGALLGQVIIEQEGQDVFELVERVRRSTIGLRRGGDPAQRRRLSRELDRVDVHEAETLIRSFSLYFQLVNLAEEKHRVRTLRKRQRAAPRGTIDGSVESAVDDLRQRWGARRVAALVERLSVALVLTAHPTEARRRTLLAALRRCYRLLDHLDDPRLTPAQDAEARRRLREEIAILWHTAPLRATAPTPLDEVRTAMAFFDESLFVVTPQLYRALDRALDRAPARERRTHSDAGALTGPAAPESGARPPRVPAFLRWGSWIGGDRDGNPNVTAAVTRQAMRIQTEHVLRAYEAVCVRLMQTVAVAVSGDGVHHRLASRLATDAAALPETARELERRFPGEPYRQRFGYIAERLRRTRSALLGPSRHGSSGDVAPGTYYGSPAALLEELDELRVALVDQRLERVAYGELQGLRWQVESFGFHAVALEVRQHSEVHERALALLSEAPGGDLDQEAAPGVTVREVLETFGAMVEHQARYGVTALHRYVVSFTRSAGDARVVLQLARAAADRGFSAGHPEGPVLDVVPLFESADALESCDAIVEEMLRDPVYRDHLRSRGDRQEVMLGYSDSTKESGSLAAGWMLYRAQERLVAVARRHGIQVTLFHGRGGAIGRGGGPTNRAILAGAPGSVDGRLKLTEQGEMIAARYANVAIAQRQLEQVTDAVLRASTPEHDEVSEAAAVRGSPIMDDLAQRARAAYRGLVWDDPGFEAFFRAATPIDELSALSLGSRPASRAKARGGDAGGAARRSGLESLRAIPWVFAWSQSRANIPGWYGLGTALAGYRSSHGPESLDDLASLYREWPFFATLLDNAEMILAKADMHIARRYASLASGKEAARIWRRILTEYRRSVELLLQVTGRTKLLDDAPVLQRSIALRNPYVDSLSELQVRLLARLRALRPDDPDRDGLLRLVHLTVSGVAAGLQNTG